MYICIYVSIYFERVCVGDSKEMQVSSDIRQWKSKSEVKVWDNSIRDLYIKYGSFFFFWIGLVSLLTSLSNLKLEWFILSIQIQILPKKNTGKTRQKQQLQSTNRKHDVILLRSVSSLPSNRNTVS